MAEFPNFQPRNLLTRLESTISRCHRLYPSCKEPPFNITPCSLRPVRVL